MRTATEVQRNAGQPHRGYTDYHYYIHLLGWTVSGDPNGTLHFTHPNGYVTLDSPLPSQTNPAP
jgi:hypothetical protein